CRHVRAATRSPSQRTRSCRGRSKSGRISCAWRAIPSEKGCRTMLSHHSPQAGHASTARIAPVASVQRKKSRGLTGQGKVPPVPAAAHLYSFRVGWTLTCPWGLDPILDKVLDLLALLRRQNREAEGVPRFFPGGELTLVTSSSACRRRWRSTGGRGRPSISAAESAALPDRVPCRDERGSRRYRSRTPCRVRPPRRCRTDHHRSATRSGAARPPEQPSWGRATCARLCPRS